MEKDRRKRIYALISISFASFVNPFMISALGVALPSIGNDFQVSPGELGLVETSFLAATVILLLPIGKYADKVGLGRIYILGMFLFMLTSLLISFSFSYNMLIGLRIVQGLAIAMVTATGAAILTNIFPSEQRGWVLGINIGAVYVGLSMGPFIGGIITDQYGWKYIFVISAFFSLIALILVSRTISYKKSKNNIHYNYSAAFQYALYIGMIWVGFTFLQKNVIYGLLIALGISGFIFLLIRQNKSTHPIIDVRLFRRNKSFSYGNLLTFINYAASIAVTFTFSLYLQYVRGFSAQETGLVLVVQPIIQMIFAPLAGRLSDKFNPNILVFLGMLFCFTGLTLVLLITQESSLILIYCLLIFFGIGFALFSSANMNQVISSVTHKFYGVATSMVGTMRTIGMLTSISIASGIFTIFIGDRQMASGLENLFLQGVRVSFLIFVFISLIGLVIAYKLLKLKSTKSE